MTKPLALRQITQKRLLAFASYLEEMPSAVFQLGAFKPVTKAKSRTAFANKSFFRPNGDLRSNLTFEEVKAANYSFGPALWASMLFRDQGLRPDKTPSEGGIESLVGVRFKTKTCKFGHIDEYAMKMFFQLDDKAYLRIFCPTSYEAGIAVKPATVAKQIRALIKARIK
jgi:hypothetical protein